jgi:hypothetical protein
VAAWVLPGLIFVPITIAMGRHYRRKFGLSGVRKARGARPEAGFIPEAA